MGKAGLQVTRARVCWIPRTISVSTAGYRFRVLSPASSLKTKGWDVRIAYKLTEPSGDILVFSKRYDEASQAFAKKAKQRGAKIIFDLFDNHFYNPNDLPVLRGASRAIDAMIALSDVVVVSTNEMKRVVENRVDDDVDIVVIGDAYDNGLSSSRPFFFAKLADRFFARNYESWINKKGPNNVRLVWFGIHGGENANYGMGDLNKLTSVLNRLRAEHSFTLTIISNSKAKYQQIRKRWEFDSRYVEWSPSNFHEILPLHDVCLIPVNKNPFTWVKTANRPITSIIHGVSVVADPVPSYLELGDFIKLGNWEKSLAEYFVNPDKRAEDVFHGRRYIQKNFSVDAIASQWSALFERVMA